MPGFALARRCAQEFPAQRTDATIGMVLMNHGMFSFGDDARESYERMIELVTHGGGLPAAARRVGAPDASALSRRVASALAAPSPSCAPRFGGRRCADDRDDDAHAEDRPPSCGRDDHAALAGPRTLDARPRHPHQAGPAHRSRRRRLRRGLPALLRTQRAPDRGCRSPCSTRRHASSSTPSSGVVTVGRTSPRRRGGARDIALHTLDAIERAVALDDWQALPEGDLFDIEYWELEQAKLKRQGAPRPSPARSPSSPAPRPASGAPRPTLSSTRGAAVVGLDIDGADRGSQRRDDVVPRPPLRRHRRGRGRRRPGDGRRSASAASTSSC